MKVLVIYRPKSDHGRQIEEFIHNYQAQEPNHKLDVIDIDSREGAATASLYDIMEYPAILVTQDNGYLHKLWIGGQLPLLREVAAYARA